MGRCKECAKRAVYAPEGCLPEYCGDHRVEGTSNVKIRKCLSCSKIPYYAYKGERAIFCKEHSKTGMVDVKNKVCKSCPKLATFGLAGEPPSFCKAHATAGMSDVKNRKCEECSRSPFYAFKGERPRYCKRHAKFGMVDVQKRSCKSCDKWPTFGVVEGKPIFCKEHMEEGMTDVKSQKCSSCTKVARYAFEGARPTFCKEHSSDGMRDVTKYRCEGVACGGTTLMNKRGSICFFCRFGGQRIKAREDRVKGWLEEWQLHWSYHDTSINDCDKIRTIKRPDFAFVIPDKEHRVILEVDEDSHRYESVSCEIDRLKRIKNAQDAPLVVVRFNPLVKHKDLLKEQLIRVIEGDGDVFSHGSGVHVIFIGYPQDRVHELVSDDNFVFTFEEHASSSKRQKRDT